jgi:uncharacterized protein YjiS (DUF1127 family)
MTTTSFPYVVAAGRRIPFPFFRLCRAGLAGLARRYDRYLQRQDLAELDDHLLRDIGLTAGDLRRECKKNLLAWLIITS